MCNVLNVMKKKRGRMQWKKISKKIQNSCHETH